jgi:hypothetical protein
LQVLMPLGAARLRVFQYHHPPAECYGVFHEFDPVEQRLTALGRLEGAVLSVPFRQTVLVPAADHLLTLLARTNELQLVDESARPLAHARTRIDQRSARRGDAQSQRRCSPSRGPRKASDAAGRARKPPARDRSPSQVVAELLAYEIWDDNLG